MVAIKPGTLEAFLYNTQQYHINFINIGFGVLLTWWNVKLCTIYS